MVKQLLRFLLSTLFGLILFFSCAEKKEKFIDYGSIDVYSSLYHNIHSHLLENELCEQCANYRDGDLLSDFGDGTAYGPALFYSLKREGRATDYESKIAEEMTERELRLIEELHEKGIFSFITEGLNDPLVISEVFVGIAGIFMAYESEKNEKYQDAVIKYYEALRPVIDLPDSTTFESFLKINIPWYGPVTLYGGLAGFFLQYPFTFGRSSPEASTFTSAGFFILDKLNQKVFDMNRNNYKYMDNELYTFIYQYSNITVMQGLIRAYLYTKDESYLERAKNVMETMEILWSEEYEGYLSAENNPEYFEFYNNIGNSQYRNEYIPLSGSNYMIYANLLMYQITEEEKYNERIKKIFDFIESKLYHDGIAWHDIQFGKLSDRYCSGCNLQLLYMIYLYDRLLKGKKILELK